MFDDLFAVWLCRFLEWRMSKRIAETSTGG